MIKNLSIIIFFFLGNQLLAQNIKKFNEALPDTGNKINQIINKEYLTNFLVKLKKIKTEGKKVTVLQLGDSHMQMGYFVEEMRSNFLNAFGLSSIGTIFPYPLAGYRPFYIKTKVISGKWQGKNYLSDEDEFKYGVSGFTIKTTDQQAAFECMPQRINKEISTGDQVIIYYNGDDNSTVEVSASNTFSDPNSFLVPTNILSESEEAKINGWKKLTCYFEKPVNNIRISVKQQANGKAFYIYGLQLNNLKQRGIVYSNCGVGGAQFSNLCNSSSFSVSQIKDIKPDLIIISYGSNESYTSAFRYDNFYKMIENYLKQVKAAVPDASIILTSPPDTRAKDRFPRNSDSIAIAYHEIANNLQLCFWDLRTQMGGNGSLFTWLKKGLASTDKLHFNPEGYYLQARLLITAIFEAYNQSVEIAERINLPVVDYNFKF